MAKPEKILTVKDLTDLRDSAVEWGIQLRSVREQSTRLAKAFAESEETRVGFESLLKEAVRRMREAGFHDVGHLRTALEEGSSWPEGYNP